MKSATKSNTDEADRLLLVAKRYIDKADRNAIDALRELSDWCEAQGVLPRATP